MASNGEQQHTPTPWFFQPINFILGDQHDDEATIIAEVDFGNTLEEGAVGEANARLIVRAVNSHEALVAALKEVDSLLKSTDELAKVIAEPKVAKVVREALALAEKES